MKRNCVLVFNYNFFASTLIISLYFSFGYQNTTFIETLADTVSESQHIDRYNCWLRIVAKTETTKNVVN